MKKFFFTFGQQHENLDGIKLRNYWVEVTADDYFTAREIFIDQFARVELPSPSAWSMQYEEHKFQPSYFPFGCLLELHQ